MKPHLSNYLQITILFICIIRQKGKYFDLDNAQHSYIIYSGVSRGVVRGLYPPPTENGLILTKYSLMNYSQILCVEN